MPNGNTIFLVCKPCCDANEADFGIKLCSRDRIGWYQHDAPTKQFDAWLSKHRKCGGRNHPDHFNLGHLFPMNGDQMPDLKVVNSAVAQALDS